MAGAKATFGVVNGCTAEAIAMKARIFTEQGDEEFLVFNLQEDAGWIHGKLERVSCSGAILALLRSLEDAANQNLLVHVEAAQQEIEALGFLVAIEGRPGVFRCESLQLMNGGDVSFKPMQQVEPSTGRQEPQSEFSDYVDLRDSGMSAIELWRRAEADGVVAIRRIRLIRAVFDLSLVDAKAVMVRASTGMGLSDHQEQFVEPLRTSLPPSPLFTKDGGMERSQPAEFNIDAVGDLVRRLRLSVAPLYTDPKAAEELLSEYANEPGGDLFLWTLLLLPESVRRHHVEKIFHFTTWAHGGIGLARLVLLSIDRKWLRVRLKGPIERLLRSPAATYDEFRRMAELAEQIDDGLLLRVVELAGQSDDVEVREVAADYAGRTGSSTVWVFRGVGGVFPSGVFASLDDGERWIRRHRLTGVLTEYLLGAGAFDQALSEGSFEPKNERERSPEFIATFSSASQAHVHYEDGARA